MGFMQRVGRTQGTLSPMTLEDLIPDDDVCRVINAFVGRLDIAELGFERAEAAETGRPGYDPRDLLKLYLYGYLQRIRSPRSNLDGGNLSYFNFRSWADALTRQPQRCCATGSIWMQCSYRFRRSVEGCSTASFAVEMLVPVEKNRS